MGGVFGALGECPQRALRSSCDIYFASATEWIKGHADARYTGRTMYAIGKRKTERKETPKIHPGPKKRKEQVSSALSQKRQEEEHAHEIR